MTPILQTWDSGFFGFPVAHVESEAHDTKQFNKALTSAREMGVILLVYKAPFGTQISCDDPHVLADTRLTYRYSIGDMALRDLPSPSYPVEIYDGKTPLPVFDLLAEKWGTHSRFYVDEMFPKSAADAMYVHWVRRMVKREMADLFLVARDRHGDIGAISSARIDSTGLGAPLMMVADDRLVGLGLGRSFVLTIMQWLKENGVENAELVAQASNRLACNTYKKLGWQLKSKQDIFHIWLGSPVILDTYI